VASQRFELFARGRALQRPLHFGEGRAQAGLDGGHRAFQDSFDFASRYLACGLNVGPGARGGAPCVAVRDDARLGVGSCALQEHAHWHSKALVKQITGDPRIFG